MAGFSGIQVALQTLLAQQAALEITQNNVANANTEGYHRQEAVLKAGYPASSMAFSNSSGVQNIGTGVYVASIKRYSLNFYDTQYRNQLSDNSYYSTIVEMLSEIETNLGDDSGDGLTDRLNNFFSAWQTVATDPDIAANREDLLETAQTLVEGFQDRASRLLQIQKDQDLSITQRVSDVNKIAAQLAELNAQIGRSQTETNQPNALLDERDRLLDQLSGLIGVTTHIQDDGQAMISIQGHALVVGSRSFELDATAQGEKNLVQINWADEPDNPLTIESGEIGGLLYARDVVIEEQLAKLDDTATSVMNRVNTIHRSGYDLDGAAGINFFTSNASAVFLSGHLNLYAGIGSTYNVDMEVRDETGTPHAVTLQFTKTATNQWTYASLTAGASIVNNDNLTTIPNGVVTFDTSGNYVSNNGRILYGTQATSLDMENLKQTGGTASSVGIDNLNDALSIRINPLITSYRQIAAATVTNAPGDGNNALAIANSVTSTTNALVAALSDFNDPVAASGEDSILHFNTSRITEFALKQRHAETGLSDTKSILSAMDDQREAVSGVNSDEEATNMVKYQRAYQAAARLMNAFDEMLELIVTNLGLVGR